jgi:hypothetical protein
MKLQDVLILSSAKSALSPCKTGHLYLALTLLDAIR